MKTDQLCKLRAAAFAAMLCVLPGWSMAQSALPPKGCTGFVTVQMRACTVSIFWRCEGAPEGTVWEGSHDLDGPYSVHTYDRDYQWLDGFYFTDGTAERIYEPGPDPISMTDLLSTGTDTYDFKIQEVSPDRGTRLLRTVGEDRFTDRTEVIDGVALREVYVASTMTDDAGDLVYQYRGVQYVWEEQRLFFLGTGTSTNGEQTWEDDGRPVEFIFPGEPGFGVMTPKYDCGDMISQQGVRERFVNALLP